MSRKLIIGLDKTPQGQDALALGALLSRAIGATPLVATALPVAISILSAKDLQAILREDTETLFTEALERLEGLDAETCAVASRSPGEFLSEMADADDAMLIVIGSGRHGILGRVFPGSVGQNLLHGAACAVAVAPRGYSEQEYQNLHCLGVAFDGSDEGWVALETAIRLAGRLNATLRVITVVEPERVGYGDAFSALSAGEYFTLNQKRHAETLEKGIAHVPSDLSVQPQLVNGEAGRAIAGASEDLDLLLIGSRGYGPVRRTLLGSTSSRVIRQSACPVLVLPRAAGDDPLELASVGEHRDPEQASAKTGH